MKKLYIHDENSAKYLLNFYSREMEFFRECIAKEESKNTIDERKVKKLSYFYEKNWNLYIQAKTYLERVL